MYINAFLLPIHALYELIQLSEQRRGTEHNRKLKYSVLPHHTYINTLILSGLNKKKCVPSYQ